jgi:hypothetical protein
MTQLEIKKFIEDSFFFIKLSDDARENIYLTPKSEMGEFLYSETRKRYYNMWYRDEVSNTTDALIEFLVNFYGAGESDVNFVLSEIRTATKPNTDDIDKLKIT